MYIMCNVVTIALVLLKFLVSLVYKKELIDLIQYAKTNFWHSNYDSHEQMIVDKCKRSCMINVCIFTCFAQGTVFSYLVEPIKGETFLQYDTIIL